MSDMPAMRAFLSDERTQLQSFLDQNRAAIAGLVAGMSPEEARVRLVPSQTTLAGIVKHCTFVERVWFVGSLLGRTRAEMGIPQDASESWVVGDDESLDDLVAQFRSACAESDEVASAFALDDRAVHNRRGPVTIRWIYVHVIEELARHAGHGDILREQVMADRTRR